MKRKTLPILGLALVLGALLVVPSGAVGAQGPKPQGGAGTMTALGTAFIYQGRLNDGGSPANGTYDFEFKLYDAATDGTLIGTVPVDDRNVVDGLFEVELDFGSGAFNGDARWLEIGVRPGSSTGAHTALTPRQALTAAPYALYAQSAPWSGLTDMPTGFADGVDDDTTFSADTTYLQRRVIDACPEGEGIRVIYADGTVTCQALTGTGGGDITAVYAGMGLTGGGETGAVTLTLDTAYTDGWYWSLTGNAGTNPSTHFLGTTDNHALELRVNNARALRLEPNATSPNVIGGYGGNSVASGVVGAAIGGGGATDHINQVTADADYATVSGGRGNTATSEGATVGGGSFNNVSNVWATVGGGYGNTASNGYATVGGGCDNDAEGYIATVGGGWNNGASGAGTTVGGGSSNIASGGTATVGGGYSNTASGDNATVPGGDRNTAQGNWSFAAGHRAKANHDGTFIWADSTDADFASTANDQFLVRASGGVALNVTGGALRLEPNFYSPNLIGGYSGNSATTGVRGAVIGGGGESGYYTNRVTDNYGTVGGGRSNRAGDDAWSTSSAPHATVGGGYHNTASNEAATAGGGYYNEANGGYATVGGGYYNEANGASATVGGGRYNETNASAATVGGGSNNRAITGTYTTVGGGHQNEASGYAATVGGGYSNIASGEYATVGGGYDDEASGEYATVGGGYQNRAITGTHTTVGSGYHNEAASCATVGGGYYNEASGDYATVGGGHDNEASGDYATVGGGRSNTAQRDYSFAAGRRAKAIHHGAFVWADGIDADFASERSNQFRVRANGGARFDVNWNSWVDIRYTSNRLINTSTDAYLSTGGT